jgi:predicted ATPase
MAAKSPPDSPVPPALSTTPFVGRERELGDLRAGLDAALAGHGHLLLLVGEPGIGKTRMAEELAAVARARGALVLWGRCLEWDGAPPYWPWRQLLRAPIQAADASMVRSDLGSAASDLAQIVPEIHEALPDLPPAANIEPEQARFRLFDGVTRFLQAVARRQPLVLILDDLHWADAPSLALLEFVAPMVADMPVLIVATYRHVEVGRQHPLARTLAVLTRQPASRRILLRGLAPDQFASLVRLLGADEPSPALVATIAAETDGNPFFVREVTQLLMVEAGLAQRAPTAGRLRVPESVREVLGRRLDRLSAACNRLLAVAAVIGREFSVPLLEHVSGSVAGDLLGWLDEAVAACLLDEQVPARRYRFSHALVQETLYQELSTAQRLALHARVGVAIEHLYAADLEPHLPDLAYHFGEAAPGGYAEQALRYASQAAEQAMAQLAWEAAITQYEHAVQVVELVSGAKVAGKEPAAC